MDKMISILSLCYCAHIKRAVCLDSCLYDYRLRGDSIMGHQTGKNNVVRINQLAQEVLKHYRQWDDCKLLAEDFSLLYVQIIMDQFVYQLQYVKDPEKYRENVISSLENWPQLRDMIFDQLNNPDVLREYYTPMNRFELIRNAKFLLGGSPTVLKITNWIIRRILNQKERLDRLVLAVKQ